MRALFPPGDIASTKTPSQWREFAFVLHQVLHAIMPAFSLQKMLAHWSEISAQLAEPPRLRALQVQKLHKTS